MILYLVLRTLNWLLLQPVHVAIVVEVAVVGGRIGQSLTFI
jgi:hypothetical protein